MKLSLWLSLAVENMDTVVNSLSSFSGWITIDMYSMNSGKLSKLKHRSISSSGYSPS